MSTSNRAPPARADQWWADPVAGTVAPYAVQAYQFALDPTPAQEAALNSHAGAKNFVFNTMLAAVKANLDQRRAERSYGVADVAVREEKGGRRGPRMGFPKFRSKRRSAKKFTFTTGIVRVDSDRKHVTLPRSGTIKTHESTRKLARRVEAGTARITRATVRFERGRWLV